MSLNKERASWIDKAAGFVEALFAGLGLAVPDEAKGFEFIFGYPPSRGTSLKRTDDAAEAVTMVSHPWEFVPKSLIVRDDGTTVGKITSNPPHVAVSPIFPYHALAISAASDRIAAGKGDAWDEFLTTPGMGATYQFLAAMIQGRLWLSAYHAPDVENGRVKAKAEKLAAIVGVSNVLMVDGLGLLLRAKVAEYVKKAGVFPGFDVAVGIPEKVEAPLQAVTLTVTSVDGTVHTIRAFIPKFAPKARKGEQKGPSDLSVLLSVVPGATITACNIKEAKDTKKAGVAAETVSDVDVADLKQAAA